MSLPSGQPIHATPIRRRGGSKSVKILLVALCFTVLLLVFAPPRMAGAPPSRINNNAIWLDASGKEIRAQGGSIVKVGDIYYWYGMDLYGGSTGEGHNVGVGDWKFRALKCYSSKDLVTWTFEKDIFKPGASGTPSWMDSKSWVGRPEVLYNSSTKQYVLIVEWNAGSSRNSILYFTSSSPVGEFVLQNSQDKLHGHTMGDMGSFKDSDGKAYLLIVSDEGGQNKTANIAELNPDYLSIKGIVQKFRNGNSEAFSVIKRDSRYYLFNSGTNWWNSTATKYRTASDLEGTWTPHTKLATTPASGNSFNTQHDFIITVTGSQQTSYVYVGDRYSNFHGTGSGRNAWYPLTFDGSGEPTLHGAQSWTIDLETGIHQEVEARMSLESGDPTGVRSDNLSGIP